MAIARLKHRRWANIFEIFVENSAIEPMPSKKSFTSRQITNKTTPVSRSEEDESLLLIDARLGIGANDQEEKQATASDVTGPPKLIFGSDSESRASTALSVPVEGVSRRQRLQRYLIRSLRQSNLVKPIDADSKYSVQLSEIQFV